MQNLSILIGITGINVSSLGNFDEVGRDVIE